MACARVGGRKQNSCSSLHIAHLPPPFWKDGCPANTYILQAFSPMGSIPGWKVLFLICAILRLLKREENKGRKKGKLPDFYFGRKLFAAHFLMSHPIEGYGESESVTYPV